MLLDAVPLSESRAPPLALPTRTYSSMPELVQSRMNHCVILWALPSINQIIVAVMISFDCDKTV